MSKTLILHVTKEDVPYINLIKPFLTGRANTIVSSTVPTACYELVLQVKKYQAIGVVTTSLELLKLLVPDDPKPSISDYAGSLITRHGVEFLIIDPLDQLVKVDYAKFITERFLSKLLAPEKWITSLPFSWELFTPDKQKVLEEFFTLCDLIAIDIETIRDDPEKAIECISFTGFIGGEGECAIRTVVVPFDSLFNIYFIRNICSNPCPKTFQNGKYDIAYLLRNGCIVTNYLFDTINLFHSWLCELPKDLGFITAMMVRSYSYHKDEGSSGGKYARFSYNAKDTYYTLLATLGLLLEMPEYGWINYFQEFPVIFPCILSEHTGIRYDAERGAKLKEQVEANLAKDLARLRVQVASPNFNPSSWQQVEKLFHVLGSKDIKGTTPKQMDKVAFRHPLNKKVLTTITEYRKNVKLNGSYFKDSVSWLGRVFYSLNPHGTDTGRLASKESQFWVGLQIQNIPRDREEGISFKEALISDPGFYFGEGDFSQAEARGTGYITGDTSLITAVENPARDFHGHNASEFFGVPYESIVKSTFNEETQEWIHKTVDKALRDLSKRTNHGANYNMGPSVLLDTMGIEKVLRAKLLLKLPVQWSLIKVTEYLLQQFAKTYPIVKGDYQEKVKADVNGSGYLVGATGWTRKCFGKPSLNKRDLNSYVAHPPQSLNAMLLNQAYRRVFHEVWLPNQNDFKLCAQIHDSILFQYRIGKEHLAAEVKRCMHLPTEVTDIFGVKRTMIVPVDLKGGSNRWSDLEPLRV